MKMRHQVIQKVGEFWRVLKLNPRSALQGRKWLPKTGWARILIFNSVFIDFLINPLSPLISFTWLISTKISVWYFILVQTLPAVHIVINIKNEVNSKLFILKYLEYLWNYWNYKAHLTFGDTLCRNLGWTFAKISLPTRHLRPCTVIISYSLDFLNLNYPN